MKRQTALDRPAPSHSMGPELSRQPRSHKMRAARRESSLLGMTALIGTATSLAFGSSYQLVALFDPICSQALSLGFVSSGPVVLLLQALLRIGPQPSRGHQAAFFFVAAAFPLLAIAAMAQLLTRHWLELQCATGTPPALAATPLCTPRTNIVAPLPVPPSPESSAVVVAGDTDTATEVFQLDEDLKAARADTPAAATDIAEEDSFVTVQGGSAPNSLREPFFTAGLRFMSGVPQADDGACLGGRSLPGAASFGPLNSRTGALPLLLSIIHI